MQKAWMRRLQIILTSTILKRRMVFGFNGEKGTDDLHISVNLTKCLSILKDKGTVQIDNLTYKEITQLIKGQYYDIEILAGYKTGGLHTIFKGGVSYISNVLGDRKSNTVYIFFASQVVAKYGQRRLNLTLNSGINMYSALEFLCRRAGVANSNVDNEFKKNIVRETITTSQTIGSIIDKITSSNNYVSQSDASYGNALSIWSPYRKDARVINIDPSTVILTSGYPSLDSSGLHMSLMPTFNFMCGDTIVIDNSIIDIGISSYNAKDLNIGYYLDENGKYIIYQIDYVLDNRGSSFSMNMLCKARSLMSKAGLNIYGGER